MSVANMWKKVLSSVMTAVLAIGLMPMSAYAAEGNLAAVETDGIPSAVSDGQSGGVEVVTAREGYMAPMETNKLVSIAYLSAESEGFQVMMPTSPAGESGDSAEMREFNRTFSRHVGDALVLTYSSGMKSRYEYAYGTEETAWSPVFRNIADSSDYIPVNEVTFGIDAWGDDDWTVGSHQLSIAYKDVHATFDVEVVANPISSLTFKPIHSPKKLRKEIDGHTFYRADSSAYFAYYTNFTNGDRLEVAYVNGESATYVYGLSPIDYRIGFINSLDAKDVLDVHSYRNYFNPNEVVVSDGPSINYGGPSISSDQSEENTWGLGAHSFAVRYLGHTAVYPVEVVENEPADLGKSAIYIGGFEEYVSVYDYSTFWRNGIFLSGLDEWGDSIWLSEQNGDLSVSYYKGDVQVVGTPEGVGTYKVVITAQDTERYTGSFERTFEIVDKKTIENTYTRRFKRVFPLGKPPSVELYDDETDELVSSDNYSVSLERCTDDHRWVACDSADSIGYYQYVIVGQNTYMGQRSFQIEVVPSNSLKLADIEVYDPLLASDTPYIPDVKVRFSSSDGDEVLLEERRDYELSFLFGDDDEEAVPVEGVSKPGYYYIVVRGIGAYQDSISEYVRVAHVEQVRAISVSQLQSAHPYADDTFVVWTYEDATATGGFRITFSSDTRTEDDYDYITIYDGAGKQIGRYSGDELANKTVAVPNSTSFRIMLTTDGSVTYYGFRVVSVMPIGAVQPQQQQPALSSEPISSPEPVAGVKTGKKASSGGAIFKVTANGSGAKATTVFTRAPKAEKAANIPATVTLNGKKYQVTGIAKGAFKGTKVKTVTVKSKKLTKKSVRGCFKKSSVKTVKVPKTKLKSYKKIFTKANCGKKVKVVAA